MSDKITAAMLGLPDEEAFMAEFDKRCVLMRACLDKCLEFKTKLTTATALLAECEAALKGAQDIIEVRQLFNKTPTAARVFEQIKTTLTRLAAHRQNEGER